jgi:hypothetical protein
VGQTACVVPVLLTRTYAERRNDTRKHARLSIRMPGSHHVGMSQTLDRAIEAPTDARPPSRESARLGGLTLPQLWAFVAVALPIVAALEASLSSIDLAYGIRLGDLMLRTHLLVRTDTLSFTATGAPWLDQQWGSQLILALIHRFGGWAGLALARAMFVGTIFFFVQKACRAAGASTRRAALLTLASFAVSLGGLSLRAQLFGMVLFALSVWIVTARHEHPQRLFLIPLIVAIWANLHGSFFLGPLLLCLAWLDDRRRSDPGARRVILMVAASLAASMVNPFGFKVWSYALGISSNSTITRFISEWQPPTIRDPAGAVFFLSVAAVAVLLARRERATPWPALVTLGVFALIGLYAVRGIFWWALIVPPLLVPLMPAPTRARRERRSPVNTVIALLVVILGISFLPWWRAANPLHPSRSAVDQAPMGLTTALERVLRPGERMFNAQIWGSWFELALPADPVFVDARIEVFPSTVWMQYQQVSFGQEGWQRVLDRWGVDVVVASRDQQAQLLPRIARDPGWRLVYEDPAGAIFVRS